MDADDAILWALSLTLLVSVVMLVVVLPINIYFDSGAETACKLAGYHDGYRAGLALGDDICIDLVQEEVLEYFLLE
jgi:hypothetical protein